jgi:hypothetical protein
MSEAVNLGPQGESDCRLNFTLEVALPFYCQNVGLLIAH